MLLILQQSDMIINKAFKIKRHAPASSKLTALYRAYLKTFRAWTGHYFTLYSHSSVKYFSASNALAVDNSCGKYSPCWA